MSSWHCIRLRAWEMKLRQQKKVAHCNWCSNLPKASRANTRPGHVAAQSQRREASIRPSEFGFLQFGRCGKIPVLMSLEPGLNIVELRAGSGHHFGDRLLRQGRCGFRRWPAWDLRSHSLDDLFGVEMIFSALKRKAFISAIDV